MTEIEMPPARVLEAFGPPSSSGDEFKVSAEWLFQSADGAVFALSDLKATNLYHPDFPSPDEYWKRTEPDELTISAIDDDVAAFKSWLCSQLGVPQA